MSEKLKIADLIRKLILSFDKYIDNFPHKELELKRVLYETVYSMLKMTYEANSTFDIKKKVDIQDKLLSEIKFLDFCLNRCYEHHIINNSRYIKFGESLGYILSLTIKWRDSSLHQLSSRA